MDLKRAVRQDSQDQMFWRSFLDIRLCCQTLALTLLISFMWMLVLQTGEAKTNYVSPGGDGSDGLTWATAYTNLQDALTNCTGAGDEIYVRYGTYTNIPSQLVISDAAGLAIYGGYAGTDAEPGPLTNLPTILQAQSGDRVLYATNAVVVFAGLTFKGGNATSTAGGGLCLANCTAALTNCVVSGNTNTTSSPGYGGGLYCFQGSLTIANSLFANNTLKMITLATTFCGGGLCSQNTSLSIMNTTFASNCVRGTMGWGGTGYGGGVYSGGATTLIIDCVFDGNYIYGFNQFSGSGLCLSGGTGSVMRTVFTNNYVSGDGYGWCQGGGLSAYNLSLLSLSSNSFLNNYSDPYAGSGGSGVYLSGCATSTVDACLFDMAGVAGSRVEQFCVAGGLQTYLINSIVRNHNSNRGIYFNGAILLMTNCLVATNSSDGLYVATGTASVANCVFYRNGNCGINCSGARMALTNCLFAQNTGDGMLLAAGTSAMMNCTMADNGGWGVTRLGGTGAVVNCVSWGNGAGGFSSNVSLAVNYSCSQNAPYGGGTSNVLGDPLFVNAPGYYYLAAYGLTNQPSSSPCIDAGAGNAADYELAGCTTRTDGSNDTGKVDMGYHYTNGVTDAAILPSNLTNCYVDAVNGADSNDGLSWVTAWKSLTKALGSVLPDATINMATGTYSAAQTSEAFPLTVRKAHVALVASNSIPSLTVIDNANNAGANVLSASGKGNIILKGLTFKSGNSSSAVGSAPAGLFFQNCTSVTLTNCVVQENTNTTTTPGLGGGLYCSQGALTIINCLFANNTLKKVTSATTFQGGALCCQNALLTIVGTTFASNRIISNTGSGGTGYGGGVYSGSSLSEINDCVFSNNYIYGFNYFAGAGLCLSGGTGSVTRTSLTNNYVSGTWGGGWCRGGGVYAGNLQILNSISNSFLNNACDVCTGSGGSGLYLTGCATAIVDGCMFDMPGISGTKAEHVGIVGGSRIAILRSTVQNHNSDRGLLFNGSAGTMLGITNCLVVKNKSDGLYIAAGTASVANCTFASNASWGITNAATLIVKNSIVWTNKLGGIASNATTAISYTDSQDAWVVGFGAYNINADPLFVDLPNNDFHEKSRRGSWHGGLWTADDLTSPCIDAGEPYPGSDFALEPEPNGKRINIGAYGNTAQASISPLARGVVFSFR